MSLPTRFTLPIQQQGKKLRQYIAAFSVCTGSLAAGAVLGWTGNISEDIKVNSYAGLIIDDNILSWIGSLAILGAATGCFCIVKFCDLLGRKKALLCLVIPFVIGWLLIIFPKFVTMIYIGRFLTGMAGGAFCVAAPLYTCEIAENDIRGTLGSYSDLFVTVGILFAYVTAFFVGINTYTVCVAVLPILFAVLFFFQPESPVHNVKRNRDDKAERILLSLRGNAYDSKTEIENIRKFLFTDSGGSVSFTESIRKKATQRASLICFGLMFFQQIGGIIAVVFYSRTIFESSRSTLDPKISTIIIGLLQVIFNSISSLAVDKLGRRILLITSNFVITLSALSLGIFLSLKERRLVDESTLTSLGLLPLISLSAFVTSFSLGMGPIPWVMLAELFPFEIKTIATGAAGTFSWLTAFFVTKFYLDFQNAIGADFTFYMFGGLSLIGTLFIYLFVPETKGKSLAEIQVELSR
ncbi:hypothetical protein FQA39_LY05453 [Lamprigera yunnana]|nr:hypothetical protein FQA39_LY05453 [Lamprigera yunnana]